MAVGLSLHTAEAFMLAPTSFVPRAGGHPSVATGTELSLGGVRYRFVLGFSKFGTHFHAQFARTNVRFNE